MAEPSRYLSTSDRSSFTPVHAVWEITLACDLKCNHCGSRAGKRRSSELTTDECLDLVRQLARMGTREVTLIGGEAYLRREAKAKGDAEDLGKLLAGVTLTFRQKVGENDQLFGSVTAKDVADALEAQRFHIERRKVALGDCGRAYGTSCPHEHSCVRCPVRRIGPGKLD